MTSPTRLTFTDFEIATNDILGANRQGPISPQWTRTKFTIPNGHEAPKLVTGWLTNNCPGLWTTYHYQDPKSKDYQDVMVVWFEDRNDALLFKLRGGHQAWQVA
jgi:hypothetical protein